MKSKKLLFSTLLMLGGIATYITMNSSATAFQGVMGSANAGTGCGSCHGSASNNTSITLLFAPALVNNTYVAGTSYTVTMGIQSATQKIKSGFDLTVSGGTISGNASGTMLMGSELHHTNPLTATMGNSETQFTWVAPSSASVDFKIAANAVNDDGNTAGDEWNKATFTFTKAAPASVSNVESTQFNLYPNPVAENVTLKTNATIQSVKAISLTGSMIQLAYSKKTNEEYNIDTKSLATGAYILLINDGKSISHKKFIKQ